MKRRVEIVIETDRVLVVGSGKSLTMKCEGCDREVRMVSVDEAAALVHESARTIFLMGGSPEGPLYRNA